MRSRLLVKAALAAAFAFVGVGHALPPGSGAATLGSQLTLAPFGTVALSRPAGAARRVVLLISDAAGPGARDAELAQSLVEAGAIVASVDLAGYSGAVSRTESRCAYAAEHFEALSQGLQKQLGLPPRM